MTDGDTVRVGGVPVRGVDVGPETRCAHYGGERDVVAIGFPCCHTFYPCFECHDAVADHPAERWPPEAFDEPAVLCGVCGGTITIERYRSGEFACPECDAAFNPGCADHYDRYFDR